MANDSIYLMSGGELVEMHNQPYESEDVLQELLAKHPDLLAGSQMNADVPRLWLLVRRELGVPGVEGEASPFSLDLPLHRPRRHPHPRRGEALDRHPSAPGGRGADARLRDERLQVLATWQGPSRELLDEWLGLIQTGAQPGRTPFGYG